jgi:hypothetical protein
LAKLIFLIATPAEFDENHAAQAGKGRLAAGAPAAALDRARLHGRGVVQVVAGAVDGGEAQALVERVRLDLGLGERTQSPRQDPGHWLPADGSATLTQVTVRHVGAGHLFHVSGEIAGTTGAGANSIRPIKTSVGKVPVQFATLSAPALTSP